MKTEFNFPKIDLHCHLDGAIDPKTMMELARERKIKLPAETLEEFIPFVTFGPGCGSVNEYLKKFDLPIEILQDAKALERVMYELVKRLDSEGLAYAEIRFAPQLATAKGMTQFEAAEAVIAGKERALSECKNIKIGIIVCAMCLGTADITRKQNFETLEVAKQLKGKGIDAFDLAGCEGICPLSDFAELFDKAREYGLNYTCHAGDSHIAAEVGTAINLFGSKRIGHGHHIFDDKELCRQAIEKDVTFEVCITSNIQCETQPSYEEHPIKKMYDMGMKVTLNTDNMVIAGVTLDSEYKIAMERCGFTMDDLIKMNINSAKASFLDEKSKAELIQKLESCLNH
ncbi:MAG: adenosine deaminase [Oscillospiraceae bacterium]